MRVCDERFDIIKGIKEDFSEKVTFKQRLDAARVGQMMNGGWSVLCRTAREKALMERSLGSFRDLNAIVGGKEEPDHQGLVDSGKGVLHRKPWKTLNRKTVKAAVYKWKQDDKPHKLL